MPKGTKKVKVGPYLPPELVESLRKSAETNRRGLSEEIQVALEQYLANQDEPSAKKLRKALDKAGISN